MTSADSNALFEHNAQQINVMNVAAGAVVKALIMELARGNKKAYIRLRNPAPRGHIVEYDFVEGDRGEIAKVGKFLGFKRVTDSQLEVHDA
jgi:hypothetical protein